jgi:hypothetical protein
MKRPFLILMGWLILTIGCNPAEQVNELDSHLVLLAENFRSESSISVPKDDEIWIGSFDNMKLVNAVFDAVYEGRVKAYDLLNNPLSTEEIKELEYSLDTAYIENFDTGELEAAVIENKLDRNDIVKVFLREDWIFDEEKFVMEKDVVSMTLTTVKFNSEGDMLGYQALFMVYFRGHEVPLPM